MPGIFGLYERDSTEEDLAQLSEKIRRGLNTDRNENLFVESTVIHPPFLLGYHSINRFRDQKGIAQEDHMTVIFEGVLFEPASLSGINPAQILALYLQGKEEFAKKIRGHFTLAVCDHKTGDLLLYTDQAASRPIYYVVEQGNFYFAGDYFALLAALPDTPDTNPQAVTDMLTFGYMIGDKSRHEGIRCAPPGSCLIWNSRTASLRIETYFTIDNTPFENQSYPEAREELQRLFVQAVERTLSKSKPIFTLSGGLDSRAILGTALKLGITNPESLTFGELDSLDVELALKVAHAAKGQAISVGLDNGSYLLDTYALASRYNGGMVYYSGSAHMLHALLKLNATRWNIMHTGMSGDMLMGSFIHRNDIHYPLSDIGILRNRIIKDLGFTRWLEHLVRDEGLATQLIHQSVENSLKTIALPSDPSMAQGLELWNLYNRQHRGMFNGFRVIENFAEYTSPFFDVDLYQYVPRIRQEYRLGEAIYTDMLSRLLPATLWRVPWAKTHRPPSQYRQINELNCQLASWMKRGINRLLPSSSANRRLSMNPFRAWLLNNEQLRQFVADRLLSWDPVPFPLEQNRIRGFAQNIANSRIDRFAPTLIFRLLTLRSWTAEK
ncbi:MAG: hypothetical protein JW892_16605 [Anaerolineae bacterium]|nr:hypothetical protein [Anaerolineae bacterium]